MRTRKRYRLFVHFVLALAMLGPTAGPALAASPGRLAPAPAGRRQIMPWHDDGLRLPDRDGSHAEGPTSVRLRAEGQDLLDLVPANLRAHTAYEATRVDSAGGAFLFRSNNILVVVPPGAFARSVQLAVVPEHSPQDVEAEEAFAISARSLVDGRPLQPTIPLHVALEVAEPSTRPDIFIGRYDTLAGRWLLPETQSHGAGLMSATLPGLGVWSVVAGTQSESSAPSPWRYQWRVPTAAPFAGAATYEKAINLPAGRGGLTPNIDVSYNSGMLNGLVFNDGQDRGALGTGWRLNHIEINRTLVDVRPSGSNWFLHHGDRFALVLNGQSYKLARASQVGAVTRFMAINGPSLKVELVAADPMTQAGLNEHGQYWRVTTGDGTVYRLGYLAEAETGQVVNNPVLLQTTGSQPSGYRPDYSPLRWHIDTITDIHGNQIQYDYVNWTSEPERHGMMPNQLVVTTESARISAIRYNYAQQAANPGQRLGGDHATRIEFAHTHDRRVTAVDIFHLDFGQPWRTIDFELSASFNDNHPCGQGHRGSHSYLVTAIRELGAEGVSLLPATTFSYSAMPHSGHPSCYRYQHLTAVENGHGGRTEFSYQHDGRQGPGVVPAYGRSYFVAEVRQFDGLHNSPAVQQYIASTPCYDQIDGVIGSLPNAWNCPQRDEVTGFDYGHGGLVGFARVEQFLFNYNGAERQHQVSHFHQDPAKVGRLSHHESLAADGFTMSRQALAYGRDAADINGDGLLDFDFTFVSSETANRFDRSGEASQTTTVNSYGRQYNRQFGNLTQVETVADIGGISGRKIKIRRDYFPNQSTWIVNAVARERHYDGAVLTAESRSSYDHGQWYYPPVNGLATRVERLVEAGEYTTEFIQYNGFANPYRVIDPLGKVTETAYDPVYNLYPLSLTNALGQVSRSGFCLVNILCDSDEPAGLLRYQTEPNGTSTFYRYDSLGRLVSRYRNEAEFQANLPVEVYSYHLIGALPHYTTTWRRTQNGAQPWSTGGSWQREFVDGLGRSIQTQQPHTDWWTAGQWTGSRVVADTSYDALGQAVRGSAPYLVSAAAESNHPFINPSQAAAQNRTRYDAAGRPVEGVDLTGAVTTSVYGLERVYLLDPNQYLKVALVDDRNQVVGLDEALIPFHDDFSKRSLPGWSTQGNVAVAGGEVRLTGNGGWNTSLARTNVAGADWGIYFRFRGDDPDQEAYFLHDSGSWGQGSFRRWALSLVDGQLSLLSTVGSGSKSLPLLPYAAGQTYHVLMRGDAATRESSIVVWRDDRPELSAEIVLDQEASLPGQGWQFMALARTDDATIWLEEYSELSFSRTRYSYDIAGQLTDVVDAAGHQTTIQYDMLGRKQSLNDPDMGLWRYGYDAAGNLTWQLDNKEQYISYTYDDLGRLLTKQHDKTLLATYGYDDQVGGNAGIGRRTSMIAYQDGIANSAFFKYDEFGQLVAELRYVAGREYGFRYEYSAGGLVTATYYPGDTYQTPAGWRYGERVTTDYHWTTGAPKSLVGDGVYVEAAAYNAAGQLTSLTLGNRMEQRFTYDGAFRLNAISSNALAADDAWLTYTYDAAGNITSITDSNPPAGSSQTQHFRYDAWHRLTSAHTSGSNMGAYSEQYRYDVLGNLLQKGVAEQRYLGQQPHALTHSDGRQVAWYDANGNMSQRRADDGVIWQQSWTVDNVLVRAASEVEDIGFVYDADSRLVMRRDHLRGQDLVQLGKLYSHDLSSGLQTKHYAFAGSLVAMREAGEVSFFLQDHLGSTLTTLWANGLVRSDRRYDVWGQLRWQQSGAVTPTGFQYTSQRWDDELGLYDYIARYYDPGTGRFLSPDAIVPGQQFAELTVDYSEAGMVGAIGAKREQVPLSLNSSVLNRFAYVENSPTAKIDPSGHVTEWLDHFGWQSWAADGGEIELTIEQAQLIQNSLEEVSAALGDVSLTAAKVASLMAVLGQLFRAIKSVMVNGAAAVRELTTVMASLAAILGGVSWETLAAAAAGLSMLLIALAVGAVLLGLISFAAWNGTNALDELAAGLESALSQASGNDRLRLSVSRNSFFADKISLSIVSAGTGASREVYSDRNWGYAGELLLFMMEVIADHSYTNVTYYYNGQTRLYFGNNQWRVVG